MLVLAGIAMPSPLRCGTGDDWSESGGPQDDKIVVVQPWNLSHLEVCYSRFGCCWSHIEEEMVYHTFFSFFIKFPNFSRTYSIRVDEKNKKY